MNNDESWSGKDEFEWLDEDAATEDGGTLPRRGARRPWWLLIVFVLVGCFIAAMIVTAARKKPVAQRPAEDPAQKFQDVREAFSGESLPENDPALAGIRRLFDVLGQAFRNRDGTAIERHFDVERMAQELERAGLDKPIPRRERAAFINGMRQGLRRQFAAQSDMMAWSRFDLKRVRLAPDRNEAQVFVRLWNVDGIDTKFRWWLKNSGGVWRAYDFEDLSTAQRASTLMAMSVNSLLDDPAKVHRMRSQAAAINQILRAVLQEDIETARRMLPGLRTDALPRPMQAMEQMVRAVVSLHDEEYAQVLEDCRRARELNNDFTGLTLLEMPALVGLERHDEALAAGRQYLDLLGEDADVHQHMGTALEGLARVDEAIEHYRKGLDDNPDHVDCLFLLGLVLPEGQQDEVRSRFLAMRDPSANFELLCDAFMSEYDVGAIAALVDGYSELAPGDVSLVYYDAWVRFQRDEDAAAADRLRPFLDQARDEAQRERLLTLYLDAMAYAGRAVEAYREHGGTRDVFRQLVQTLNGIGDDEALDELLAAHESRDARDPELSIQRGLLHYRQKDYESAIASLRRAASVVDAQRADELYWTLSDALYDAGRPQEAYREGPDRAASFRHVASRLYDDERPDELRQLVELHRQSRPDDIWLHYHAAEAAELEDKWDESVTELWAGFERAGDDDRETFRVSLVYALYRAGRGVEALQTVPPTDETFLQLGRLSMSHEDPETLQNVVESYRAQSPDDPQIAYYTAWIAFQAENYSQAAELLRPLLEIGDVEDWKYSERLRLYLDAMDADGRAMEAYHSLAGTGPVFQMLARKMFDETRPDDLETLLAAHRKRQPDNAAIHFWQAQRHALSEEHDAVVRILTEHAATVPDDYESRWLANQLLVDTLLNLGRHEEALERAVAHREFHGDSLLVAAVHADRGDVPATLAALEACEEEGDTPESMYAHPLLGPRLRSEAMAAVREKYPEPEPVE